MAPMLDPTKGYIFRITHRDNVEWALDNGLQSRNSPRHDGSFVNIGNRELISKRHRRQVPLGPGGTLSDYVPFYFTPHSPMLYNIKTGYSGIPKRENEEIVFFVTRLSVLRKHNVDFVFTDRHAYMQTANYYDDLNDLHRIDWPLLRQRDFRHDPEDPGKMERYQAEALVYIEVPIEAIQAIACCGEAVRNSLQKLADARNIAVRIIHKPSLYFR